MNPSFSAASNAGSSGAGGGVVPRTFDSAPSSSAAQPNPAQAPSASCSARRPQPNWIFSSDELLRIPSVKDGYSPEHELKMRQQAAVFIQEMGDKLNSNIREPNGRGKITQFCMCVAMVHLHRFFVIHSMRTFDPRDVAAACLFLAGKGEECPRKLEHIVNVWFRLKNRNLERQISLDHKVFLFLLNPKTTANNSVCLQIVEQCSEYIVLLESIVLQTIGWLFL